MLKKFNESFKTVLAYSVFSMKFLRIEDNVAMKVKFRKTVNELGNNPVYHVSGWYIPNPEEGK